MPNAPDRVSVPMSDTVRRRLKELAAQWTREEGLTREPTYDEVIRRLLGVYDRDGQLAEYRTREGTR